MQGLEYHESSAPDTHVPRPPHRSLSIVFLSSKYISNGSAQCGQDLESMVAVISASAVGPLSRYPRPKQKLKLT